MGCTKSFTDLFEDLSARLRTTSAGRRSISSVLQIRRGHIRTICKRAPDDAHFKSEWKTTASLCALTGKYNQSGARNK